MYHVCFDLLRVLSLLQFTDCKMIITAGDPRPAVSDAADQAKKDQQRQLQ
jgi:hypothetical protein